MIKSLSGALTRLSAILIMLWQGGLKAIETLLSIDYNAPMATTICAVELAKLGGIACFVIAFVVVFGDVVNIGSKLFLRGLQELKTAQVSKEPSAPIKRKFTPEEIAEISEIVKEAEKLKVTYQPTD